MNPTTIRIAQVGYGMFGSDVVAGTMWDLQRNGISPFLDRVGLDDRAADYWNVNFEMVGIGTRSDKSARRGCSLNRKHTGVSPKAYSGEAPWDAILAEHPDLDVLVVATPDHLHTAPILAALKAGVHVIAEKPLCLSLHEADHIIGLAREKGLIVGVDMHKRYDPDHLRIFRELAPQMGLPIHARGVLEEPLEVSTKTFKWVEDSDPFTYVGIHWVDLFCHYLKLQPLSLFAVGEKQRLRSEFGKDAFDATQVLVTHKNGMAISYENTWLTPADFEGPVNQESHYLAGLGKVESDSQYRGLRYWIERRGSRTANTHFFRWVQRPDGSLGCTGYGKDSLVDCMERILRVKLQGASAESLAGTYPDAASLRTPTAIIHAAREVLARNRRYWDAGRPPVVTAGFDAEGIMVYDPHAGDERIYQGTL
jgi:predicted dehydrogenase